MIEKLDQATEERKTQRILSQQNRLNSLIRVLAHYEAEDVTAFKILGIPITQQLLQLVIGLGAGSIIGMVNDILSGSGKARPVFMCHGVSGGSN